MKLQLSKTWKDLLLGLGLLALFYLLLLMLTSCASRPPRVAFVASPAPMPETRAAIDPFGPNPIAPSKLAVSHPAPYLGTVTLVWDPSPDATVTGYFLYCGLASGVYSNKMDAGFQTNATVAGLVASNTYYFVATAYTENAQLESPFSNEATWTAPPLYYPNAIALSVEASDTSAGPWVDLPAAWVLPSAGHAQVYRVKIEPTNLPPLTNAAWPLKVRIIQQ
jgi:hypothetical protein